MKQKLSYINISRQELKSLYKLYYIKKLTKNIIFDKSSPISEEYTTFIFYGTRIIITPLKRIECNKFFNKKKEEVLINFSIRSYTNFSSLINFSKLNQIKNIIKGTVFYQLEIRVKKNIFDKSLTNFEIQARIYNFVLSSFDQYINIDIQKTKKVSFFPSIIYIPLQNEITSLIRYSSLYNWRNKQTYLSDNSVSIGLIQIFNYNQIELISVLLYNQSKKIT